METGTQRQVDGQSNVIRQECPGCGGPQTTVFFESENAPIFCNVLWPSRQRALATARAEIRLAFCRRCGLVYNAAFDPQLMEYEPGYENPLHFSPHFRQYAKELAAELIERHHLRNKHIVDIGCGDADFLRRLCQMGPNRGTGFDPSRTGRIAETNGVTIVPQAYSQAHGRGAADFVCCRHVLEHIARPLDFLKDVRDTIGQGADCPVYFEVPNALYSFKEMGVWDIIYEHYSYFTSQSLANLFVRAGFEPIRVTERYAGQFLGIEARADSEMTSDCPPAAPELVGLIEEFGRAYQDKLSLWQNRLTQFRKDKSQVVLWGAGSKSVTFLNVLDIRAGQIEYVVDLNPRKQGLFVAGAGQQVVAPDLLKDYRPDTVIIMNPIYRPEIQKSIESLGIKTDILTA
jgi:hypothetical protein